MDSSLPNNDHDYWLVTPDAENQEVDGDTNTNAAPENHVPVEPIQLQVEVDDDPGEGTSAGPQASREIGPWRFEWDMLVKCICIDCFPLFSVLYPNAEPRFLQCGICEKTFSKCKYYRRHMGLHAKTKSLKCDLCNLTFMFSYQLQAHRLTHTHGQRPFKCRTCGKSFTSKYYLKQHQWSHNPVSSYRCPFCGKGYNSEGFFRRHQQSHTQ